MTPIIETLECRALFTGVVHADMLVMQREIATLGQPVPAIVHTYNAAMLNVRQELRLFSSATEDAATLTTVETTFTTDSKILSGDISAAKILLTRDMNAVLTSVNLANHHSLNAAFAAHASAAVSLLQVQTTTAKVALAEDYQNLANDYSNAIGGLLTAHKIDATLATEATTVSTAIETNGNLIAGDASQIVDASNAFIAAADPSSQGGGV